MKKARWLDRTLLTSPVYFCLCTTPAQFEHELRRMNVPRSDWPSFSGKYAGATTHTFETADDHKMACIVTLYPSERATPVQIAALLVHEAVHIWQSARDSIGERSPSSEMEAYAIQSISQELMLAYAETLQ